MFYEFNFFFNATAIPCKRKRLPPSFSCLTYFSIQITRNLSHESFAMHLHVVSFAKLLRTYDDLCMTEALLLAPNIHCKWVKKEKSSAQQHNYSSWKFTLTRKSAITTTTDVSDRRGSGEVIQPETHVRRVDLRFSPSRSMGFLFLRPSTET